MSFNIIKEYIAIIQKDEESDYGVIFPNFLNCISCEPTLEEVKNMAKEVLQFHIDSMIEDGDEIPAPLQLDKIKKTIQIQKCY
jgi:predicted RNase H-like HicB family nuclease